MNACNKKSLRRTVFLRKNRIAKKQAVSKQQDKFVCVGTRHPDLFLEIYFCCYALLKSAHSLTQSFAIHLDDGDMLEFRLFFICVQFVCDVMRKQAEYQKNDSQHPTEKRR